MAQSSRVTLFTLLTLGVAAPLAGAQNPEYNRTFIDMTLTPASTGPGSYELQVEWGVRRDSSMATSLDLSTDIQVFVNGGTTMVAGRIVPVTFDSPYDGCSALGCQNMWGCANLTIDGQLLLGQCQDLGGAPDDTHYCQCGASTTTSLGVIPLTPGDELMILLKPAPGALPELPGFPDDENVERLPPDGVRSFCAGDGSGTPCPCNNTGDNGHGYENSTGEGGLLFAAGTVSVGSDDLAFLASQLPAGQPGLLFSGTNQVNGGDGVVFGDGLRCVGGTVVRLGVKTANAAGEVSWGPGLAAAHGWQDNDIVDVQLWYRDPLNGPCGTGFNLTNALEMVLDA